MSKMYKKIKEIIKENIDKLGSEVLILTIKK